MFNHFRLVKRKFYSTVVNFVYTLFRTLFIQMWSIFIHLKGIYTIVVGFYTLEGGFIHLWKFINSRVQQTLVLFLSNVTMILAVSPWVRSTGSKTNQTKTLTPKPKSLAQDSNTRMPTTIMMKNEDKIKRVTLGNKLACRCSFIF